jgi:hypothetical protein
MDRTIKKEANKFRKHKLTCSDACVMLLWVFIHTGQAWKICGPHRAGLKNMRATVGSGVDIHHTSILFTWVHYTNTANFLTCSFTWTLWKVEYNPSKQHGKCKKSQTTQPCFQCHRSASYCHMINKAYNTLKGNNLLTIIKTFYLLYNRN